AAQDVVAGGAARAPDEARQARDGDGMVDREEALQFAERIVGGPALDASAGRLELHLAPAHAQDLNRLGPEEAEATPALTTLHALEQEAGGPTGDLPEAGDRRLRDGEDG